MAILKAHLADAKAKNWQGGLPPRLSALHITLRSQAPPGRCHSRRRASQATRHPCSPGMVGVNCIIKLLING